MEHSHSHRLVVAAGRRALVQVLGRRNCRARVGEPRLVGEGSPQGCRAGEWHSGLELNLAGEGSSYSGGSSWGPGEAGGVQHGERRGRAPDHRIPRRGLVGHTLVFSQFCLDLDEKGSVTNSRVLERERERSSLRSRCC